MKQIDLVIYHGNCPDGIAGAWCFWHHLGKDITKFHPGKFGDPPPDVKGKHVLFVDFTYRREETEKLLETASSITILDHHKTANDLKDIDRAKYPNFQLILDMDRSGAQLGWDYMEFMKTSNFTDQTNLIDLSCSSNRPWFINDIADRDLWKWSIDNSKFVTRALYALGYYESLYKFNELFYKISDMFFRAQLVPYGMLLVKEDEKLYEIMCKYAVDCECRPPKDTSILYKVRLVAGTGAQASDVGNMLVKDGLCDFAAIYRYDIISDEWWISLRANTISSIDLTEVCKLFDSGGGHAKAAGITLFGNKGQSLRSVFTPVEKNKRFHMPVEVLKDNESLVVSVIPDVSNS